MVGKDVGRRREQRRVRDGGLPVVLLMGSGSGRGGVGVARGRAGRWCVVITRRRCGLRGTRRRVARRRGVFVVVARGRRRRLGRRRTWRRCIFLVTRHRGSYPLRRRAGRRRTRRRCIVLVARRRGSYSLRRRTGRRRVFIIARGWRMLRRRTRRSRVRSLCCSRRVLLGHDCRRFGSSGGRVALGFAAEAHDDEGEGEKGTVKGRTLSAVPLRVFFLLRLLPLCVPGF